MQYVDSGPSRKRSANLCPRDISVHRAARAVDIACIQQRCHKTICLIFRADRSFESGKKTRRRGEKSKEGNLAGSKARSGDAAPSQSGTERKNAADDLMAGQEEEVEIRIATRYSIRAKLRTGRRETCHFRCG